MSANEDQARSIFLAALDRATEQWPAFLDEACGGDAAIRDRAERLLRAHAEMGSIPAGRLDSAADMPPAEGLGATIGPYKLLEPIGEGGFGVVFLAEQAQPMRRKVALKVLKPGMDSRQVVVRFEAERQALALMDHPNIARVFDGGATSSGRPYFVMEFIKGIPITDFCDQNRLPPRQRLELFLQVCGAVQHAHQKGIIHRDIKPSNVLVSRHDTTRVVKVIDFGVAKAVGQELTDQTLFTGVAQMIGTPLYMSPEQAGMSDLDVDTRSDIYSLGVLLYELLTGTTPFEKERFKAVGYDEIRRIIREEEPPRPSTRLSTLGRAAETVSAGRGAEPRKLSRLLRGELDWVVMMALEKDRTRRYETANEFAADVGYYLADEPVRARPLSTSYRLRKFVRRNRGPVLASALLFLAMVAGATGTISGLVREWDARATAELRSRHADENLFGSYLSEARALRTSRRPGQRFESLDVLRRATDLAHALELPGEGFDELRDAAIAALALPDLYPTGPWVPWPADAVAVDFDQSHTLYARIDRQGNCTVRRVADDAEVHRLPGRGVATYPYFSPDGQFLAVGQYHGGAPKETLMEVWELGPTTARKVLSEESGWSVAFHPHRPQVALSYTDGTIGLFELPSGRPLNRLPRDTLWREVVTSLHPTEPVVAVCSYFGSEVQLRDLNTRKVLARIPQDGGGASGIAWHPDGRTLAVSQPSARRICLYDHATLRVVRTFADPQNAANASFNPTGDRLVATGWGGGVDVFDVGTGQRLFSTGPTLGLPRFSRDGRQLSGAFRDGKLGFWQVGDSRELRTLIRQAMPEKSQFSYSTAESPDGQLLAAAMTDGVSLWDLTSGTELAFIRLPTPNGTNRVLFEPSGALLTLSESGLSRWPVKATAPYRFVIGPPEPLPLPPGSGLGQSRDGRVIVTCSRNINIEESYAGGWVRHANRPDSPIRLDSGADINWIVVSPDGQWVVTAAHEGGAVKIWRANDGTLVKTLAEYGGGLPRFSPDGCWLSTALDGGRLIAVGTWEPGPRVGGAGDFSPDSKLITVTNGSATRLVEVATGRTLAKLEDPDLETVHMFAFASDGTRLLGTSNGKVKGVRVWDLRRIRQQLAKMGLDWDAPPYPPAAAESDTGPRTVVVRSGGPARPSRAEKARQDIEACRRLLKTNPDDAAACNNLAWFYLTAPEPLRDVAAAVPLAEKAVRLSPANAVPANTLGVAYYRDGRYREAVGVLRPNLARQQDRYLAFDLYFLALSHHRLGEATRARDYYDWAVRWTKTQRKLTADQVEELALFRAEAEELLGIAVKGGVEAAPPPRPKK